MSTIYVTDGAAHAAIRIGGALSTWGRRHVAQAEEQSSDAAIVTAERRSAEARFAERKLDAIRLRSFH
jgi:hypothetical protein